MDQQLLRDLRKEVAESLSAQRREDSANGLPTMSSEDERQYARAVIARVLEGHAAREIAAGRTPPVGHRGVRARRGHPRGACTASAGSSRCWTTPRSRTSTSTAVTPCSSATPTVEEKRFPPVAETDEELIELVQVLGAYSSITSRPFDTANPQLDLRLPDGSRLSAVMGVCQRPSLSIRRARIGRASLDMLVDNGSISRRAGRLPAPPPSRPARTS